MKWQKRDTQFVCIIKQEFIEIAGSETQLISIIKQDTYKMTERES